MKNFGTAGVAFSNSENKSKKAKFKVLKPIKAQKCTINQY
jgi:hypothetical protein